MKNLLISLILIILVLLIAYWWKYIFVNVYITIIVCGILSQLALLYAIKKV